ncbi:MAG: hypothetical protein RH860_03900 [Cytophagales bacterium]
MNLKSYLAVLSLLISQIALGGEITLVGQYHGKDLYVQNPFNGSSTSEYCVEEVYINGKLKPHKNQGAFIISLNYLTMDEAIEIRIVHKDGCTPKILNPNVFVTNKAFKFESFDVNSDGVNWSSIGEKPQNTYKVEHFVNNTWKVVGEVSSQGRPGTNSYSLKTYHHSGNNKYRIKYEERTGQVYNTRIKEFTSDLPPVTFNPPKPKDKLILSRETDYEILDHFGNEIKKGRATEIDVSDLKTGQVYYLVIDNRTENFFKK